MLSTPQAARKTVFYIGYFMLVWCAASLMTSLGITNNWIRLPFIYALLMAPLIFNYARSKFYGELSSEERAYPWIWRAYLRGIRTWWYRYTYMLIAWLAIGLAIYFGYGLNRSALAPQPRPGPAE